MSLPLRCHCCMHQVLSVSEGHFTFSITVSKFTLISHVMLAYISELEKEQSFTAPNHHPLFSHNMLLHAWKISES